MFLHIKKHVTYLSSDVCVCFLFSPREVIKVDAVLGLVTPIGAQMEHDRERVSILQLPRLS